MIGRKSGLRSTRVHRRGGEDAVGAKIAYIKRGSPACVVRPHASLGYEPPLDAALQVRVARDAQEEELLSRKKH